jgi:hypothetical protein
VKRHLVLRNVTITGWLACHLLPAWALDWQVGSDTRLRLNMATTVGTSYRTEAPDPAVLGSVSGTRLGVGPGQLGGNAGGNDLNFQRGQAVSTVLKSLLELDLKHQQSGLFARAKIWHDFALENRNRPYGNATNGFQTNGPLSDRGFEPNARFSNAQFADVYGYTRFEWGKDLQLDARLGRQSLDWGVAKMVTGGINAINPVDFPARFRPGALPQETQVPVGMLYASLHPGQDHELDAFVRYESRHNVLLPCGTFYAAANYLAPGCNYVSVLGSAGVSDPTAFASGRFGHRQADAIPPASGQFGFSARYTAQALGAIFRAYAARYHANAPGIRVINPDIAGGYGTLANRLTDPNGLKYQVAYAPGVRLFGMSAESLARGNTRWFAEVAYRPNQALNLNASDLVGAFFTRAPNSALNRALQTNLLAPGAVFSGYQRFAVSQASAGASYSLNHIAAAEKVTLSAEAGFSHVAGLPAPAVLRFGRSDDYGTAAINGLPCVDTTVAQKSCALDGFVTPNAWGYRLSLDARYQAWSVQWTPSLMWSHDVRGYSPDGVFLQGRRIVRAGLRLDWQSHYFAQTQYNRIAGGAYNNQIDRDTLTLALGAHF